LLGVLAIGKGQLLEPRFNVGREMYFHTLQDTRKPEVRQHRKRGWGIHCLSIVPPTNTRNIAVSAPYPWHVLAS
jgi:hypothetical protein